MHFNNCHTPDELYTQYRYWAKKLHPDSGGNHHDFIEMKTEYENRKTEINNYVDRLPDFFRKSISYEYFRRKVNYIGTVYGYYYKFIQDFGADILIDLDNVKLIYEQRKYI